MSMITGRLVENMLWDRWARGVFGFTCLDRGFLINTNDPGALLEQGLGLFIQMQDWTRALQEGFLVLDLLPGMETPRTNLLSGEPTPNGPR